MLIGVCCILSEDGKVSGFCGVGVELGFGGEGALGGFSF